MDFESADVRDVIRLMSETSNINMIFGPEVNGNISIHLKKVPFAEAFQTNLNLKGLVAAQLGTNILRITTPDNLKQDKTKAIVYTRIIPVNYIDAEEMKKHIQAVMASSGRKGTITVVKESNSLVLTDSQEGLDQAQRLIGKLDIKPQQVLIESRIVEINLNVGFDIGVQWEYGQLDVSRDNGGFNFLGTISDDSDGSRVPWNFNSLTGRGANTPGNQGTGCVTRRSDKRRGYNFRFCRK